jgi:predicted trehalose synthase
MEPAVPYETTLETVAAGRAATVAQLHQLADRLEQVPLDAVAEVLVLLEPALDDLRRQAAFALERAPTGAG